MTQNKQKIGTLFHVLLRWGIALAALVFIYLKLSGSMRQDWWPAFLERVGDSDSLSWMIACVLLLPLNWMLEALKWRWLLRPLEQVSLARSVQGVLAGLAVSVFTPNRIGEYAGRVFVLRHADRIAAAMATVLSSMSQLVVTLVAGVFAALWYFPRREEWPALMTGSLLVFSFLSALLTAILFLKPRILDWLVRNLPLPGVWRKHTAFFQSYKLPDLLYALVLSVLRYAVFSTQFFLLIRFFGAEVPVVPALLSIAIVYLFMAIIPTVAVLEIGLRGGVAIAVFSPLTDRLEAVVFASALLWAVNLMLPAIAGTYFVSRLDFSRQQDV